MVILLSVTSGLNLCQRSLGYTLFSVCWPCWVMHYTCRSCRVLYLLVIAGLCYSEIAGLEYSEIACYMIQRSLDDIQRSLGYVIWRLFVIFFRDCWIMTFRDRWVMLFKDRWSISFGDRLACDSEIAGLYYLEIACYTLQRSLGYIFWRSLVIFFRDRWVISLRDRWVLSIRDRWVIFCDHWYISINDRWVISLRDHWVILSSDRWVIHCCVGAGLCIIPRSVFEINT